MASTYSAYAYYINGWCRGCGRKRNRDGSCSNCDRWYNSPLIAAGGPLLIATVTLLAVGIHMLRPPAAAIRPLPSAVLSGTPAASAAPRRPVGPYIAAPAGFAGALPPQNLPFATAAPAGGGYSYYYNAQLADAERQRREQAQFMQLEELRRTVAYADAVVRADDALQLAQTARSTWRAQGTPAMVSASAALPMRQVAPALPMSVSGNSAAVQPVF